jgi:hypothetical protein
MSDAQINRTASSSRRITPSHQQFIDRERDKIELKRKKFASSKTTASEDILANQLPRYSAMRPELDHRLWGLNAEERARLLGFYEEARV